MCEDINSIDDATIKSQATSFCELMSQYIQYTGVTFSLPEMYFTQEDDEAYFEWIFDQFRFGFVFAANPNESGWFQLSSFNESMERFKSK